MNEETSQTTEDQVVEQRHEKKHHYKHVTESNDQVENRTRNVAGILIIIFGIYLLLDNLNFFDINIGRIVMTWWPLLIVYVGFELLSKNRPGLRTIWYIILIASVAYILMTSIFR